MLGMIKPSEGYTKEEMDFFKPETLSTQKKMHTDGKRWSSKS